MCKLMAGIKQSHQYLIYVYFMTTLNRSCGLVVRASAARSGGRGFESQPYHTKDFKNGTYCLLVIPSTLKERSGGINMGSYQWTNPPL